MKSDKWKKYFRAFSNPYGTYGPEEYHAWLALAGLEELKVKMTIEEMILPWRAGLKGFIRTTWLPITEQVPEKLRPELIWEISESHLDSHLLRDGLASFGMQVLLVEARRPQ